MSCILDPDFVILRLDATVLSPFATEFRYPTDDETTLERKVVLDAINRAKNILTFVEKKLYASS
jgi:hypothetical protein